MEWILKSSASTLEEKFLEMTIKRARWGKMMRYMKVEWSQVLLEKMTVNRILAS